ncbi:MAG: rhodanese-like domain-containing protein [Ilumatobacteraceae bacterium]
MSEFPEIAVETLSTLLAEGAGVVDVREPDEYQSGHVPGARLIPLGEVPARVAEFPADSPIYVVCRSGARSGRACEFLRQQGSDAINVGGGTLAWIEAGFEVVTGNDPA